MIQFTPMSVAEIEAEWPDMASYLKRAILIDPANSLAEAYAEMLDGQLLVMRLGGAASGYMVFEVTPEAVCWVRYLGARVQGGPRQRFAHMRAAMSRIEQVALSSGCHEIRIAGRDWRCLLTDYQLMSNEPNGLRKVLRMKEAA